MVSWSNRPLLLGEGRGEGLAARRIHSPYFFGWRMALKKGSEESLSSSTLCPHPSPLPMGEGALVALSHLRFTELLQRSEEVLAIAVLFKIDAMALRDPPLRGLDELGLPGNIIAEAARGPAAFETSAHEEAVRDCAG